MWSFQQLLCMCVCVCVCSACMLCYGTWFLFYFLCVYLNLCTLLHSVQHKVFPCGNLWVHICVRARVHAHLFLHTPQTVLYGRWLTKLNTDPRDEFGQAETTRTRYMHAESWLANSFVVSFSLSPPLSRTHTHINAHAHTHAHQLTQLHRDAQRDGNKSTQRTS